jgi:hypothetical protein
VVCQSWSSKQYRGRAASHFSRGGQITMKGYPTEPAVLAAARLTAPTVVKQPVITPYLRGQLEYLELLKAEDLHGTIHDPITIDGHTIDRTSPRLFCYNPESQIETLWDAPRSDAPMAIASSHIAGVDLTPHCPPSSASIPTKIQRSSRPPPAPGLSTGDSLASSLYSSSEEWDRSKDRLKSLDILPLPMANKDLHQWVQNLPWQLSRQHWCHDQVHAFDILVTTPDTVSLSKDFLTVLMRSATAHKNLAVQRAAQSLLQEEVLGINGLTLIKRGKGFELFQTRVKTGFSRGLGTETYEALWEYVHSVQQNNETAGAYFERLKQLYGQVQLTKGCELGDISWKTLALKGLENGAYHEILGPWVKKVLARQHKLKIEGASMEDIQSLATNILCNM